MTATPTPGDLSARLLAEAKAFERMAGRAYAPDALEDEGTARLLRSAAAALSALPAAGEKWEADGIKEALQLGRLKGHEVFYTTPQPSAAEDADVGAQGDISSLTLAVIGREYFGNPIPHEWYAAARELIRCLATPAAGKGVDDAMRKRAREWLAANNGYWDDDYIERLLRAILPQAALTRQPVAGDGMVLVPREPTPAMLIPLVRRSFQDHWEAGKRLQSEQLQRSSAAGNYGYQDWMIPPKTEYEVAAGQYLAMLAAAPAATPTDGGEG